MKLQELFNPANQRRFAELIRPYCGTEPVRRLRQFAHHKRINRYDHVLLVSYISFALARRWRWDERAAARAGLLHDLFFTDCDNSWHLCMTHPETAAKNAEALTGDLTDKERNIILSHMWPAGRHLPRSREAWLVDMVDNYVTLLDMTDRSPKWSRKLDAVLAV